MSDNEFLSQEERHEAENGLMEEIINFQMKQKDASSQRDLFKRIAKGRQLPPLIVFEDGTVSEDFDDDLVPSDNEKDLDFLPKSTAKRNAPKRNAPKRNPAKKSKKSTKKESEFEIKVAVCKAIRDHPQVYQITHKEYSNKQIRDAQWLEISQKVSKLVGEDTDVDKCRKIWNALRESTR